MSNETGLTIIAPRSLTELQDLAKALAPAATLPQALRGKPAEVMLAIMTGAELGLSPMASIRGIHIIDGKPTLAADLMAGVVMGSPLCEHLRVVETTAQVARYAAKRRGQPEVALAFTMAQATAAGLAGRGNWGKYPDAMLRARACAAICRMVWPDLLAGVYDPDELAHNEKPVNAAPPTKAWLDTRAHAQELINAGRIPGVPTPKPSPQDAAFRPEGKTIAGPTQTAPDMPKPRARIVDAETGEDVRKPATMAEAVATVERAIAKDAAAITATPWEALMGECRARSLTDADARAWLKANFEGISKNKLTLDHVAAFVAAHPVEAKAEEVPF